MLEELKARVLDVNRGLIEHGLVLSSWGNASGIDRDAGAVVIKPSGLEAGKLKIDDMAVVSVETGEVIEGKLKPSSDTDTHLALYRAWEHVGGVVHTHSAAATAWAQAGKEIPCLGTTHADFANGAIPCTRKLIEEEIAGDYVATTGKVIIESFASLEAQDFPGVLVASHGPFTWGDSPEEALHNAVVLEYVAQVAAQTLAINPAAGPVNPTLLKKHFKRKHGPDATYGQRDTDESAH